jgi:DNA-binding transcriptional ArsR family regulator
MPPIGGRGTPFPNGEVVTSPLEGVVKHGGRLDILACLVDGEPLAVSQLSAETGLSRTAVRHHIKLLDSFDLVERTDGLGGEPL